jgi:hypothetical protein
MSTNQRKTIDLSSIDLAPVLVAADSFLDAASDFADIASREKSGPSRALMSLHTDAVFKLHALRRCLTQAGLYDLSRHRDRAGEYDGPILMMKGEAGDPRSEICTHTDYLRASVADLWKHVRPYFREEGLKYEFSIEDREVKQFCFDDSAVVRLKIATGRLRALTRLTAPKMPSTAGGDNFSDNSKKTSKRRPRGSYKAERNAMIVRKVDAKVRDGRSKQEAFEEIGYELSENPKTIRRAYYRALQEPGQARQPRRRNQ